MSDFVRLVSSHVGSYLGWIISQVAVLASLMLEFLCFKWCDFISSHKLSSSLPLLSLFTSSSPLHIHFLLLFNLFFTLFFFFICSLSLIPLHYCHLIISFSLCPSEVNFHTYLNTWLSSCSLRIFVGFSL